MGRSLFEVIGISVARHVVVGLLTAGTGNAALLALDAMDIHDAMDAMDAMDAVSAPGDSSSGSGELRFGANGNDGFYAQGVDNNGNSVSQSPLGPAYSTNDPSKTYGPYDVTWPSPSDSSSSQGNTSSSSGSNDSSNTQESNNGSATSFY